MFKIWGDERYLPPGKDFSFLIEFEIDLLKEMNLSLKDKFNEDRSRLQSIAEKLKPEEYESEHDYEMHKDSLYDDIVQTMKIESVSTQISVVALYMILEKMTKMILNWVIKDVKNNKKEEILRELYRWKKLKKELKKRFNLNLEDISEYEVIDELRCLNNAIKHNGYVDNDLSKFPNWKEDKDKEIDSDKINLEKFYSSVPKYIEDLAEQINKKLISKEKLKKESC